MPAGIITRFISRIHYLIRDDHYWNSGVELGFSGSLALVIGDSPRKRIRVSVSGSDSTQLMGVIRSHFDHIHQTLNMKKDEHFFEEVPCNCPECIGLDKPHLYKYSVLNKLLSMGREVLCEKSFKDVSVSRLTRGLLPPVQPKNLFDTMITTLSQLQGIKKTLQPDENSRNTVVSLLLCTSGFRAKDQTLWGTSASGDEHGSKPGELDIKIEDETGRTVSIIEALNLDSVKTKTIDGHVKKLFKNYDCSGLKENYIVAYVSVNDFDLFYEKYWKHLDDIDYETYPLKKKIETVKTGFNKIAAFRGTHRSHHGETILNHIIVEM